MIEPKWLAARTEDVKRADKIDPQLYQKYNVKRGLRNSDGTGVLVGLTTIGNVHGYYLSEGEKIAIPGQLFYRGVDVEDIVPQIIKTASKSTTPPTIVANKALFSNNLLKSICPSLSYYTQISVL